MKGKVLGKGLSALISDDSNGTKDESYLPNLSINLIKPNPHQPRIEIKPETLIGLSDSIREHGIIEPLIVTQKGTDEYELIAGERRLKAAKLAGLKEVPVLVKEATPQKMLEMAIVENVQRADLNPLEEALAYKQLVDGFKANPSSIGEKVGLSRSAVVNKIRLLNLPEEIKKGLLENNITEGHARALLGLTDKPTLISAYNKTVAEKLSVRAVEELVRRINAGNDMINKTSDRTLDKTAIRYEQDLRNSTGFNVRITKSNRGGKVVIPYKTDEDLEKIYKILTTA